MSEFHYDSRHENTAEVIASNDERVLYRCWDKHGDLLQSNGCRSPAAFFADFDSIVTRRPRKVAA